MKKPTFELFTDSIDAALIVTPCICGGSGSMHDYKGFWLGISWLRWFTGVKVKF